MINISYSDKEDTMYCTFEGHLGADRAAIITETINGKIKEIRGAVDSADSFKVVFDLKEVNFIASSFIRICIATLKDVGHSNFAVINTKPIIKKTFAMAGLSDEMNVS